MPGVLNDASFLRQDLDEPLGLPLVEHHASNRGDQRLVGEVERAVGVRGPCAVREKEQGLTLRPSNQAGSASKQQGQAEPRAVQLPGLCRLSAEPAWVPQALSEY